MACGRGAKQEVPGGPPPSTTVARGLRAPRSTEAAQAGRNSPPIPGRIRSAPTSAATASRGLRRLNCSPTAPETLRVRRTYHSTCLPAASHRAIPDSRTASKPSYPAVLQECCGVPTAS
ncbi:hypothetical protein IscW_ISCW004983 [Ixodes scapularis]|uniref:Uncharacterized protein n=1 Tax=Ixodes scapularis TaxID=6945 RepID=B7PFV6_IXOSC|nr:hypothetical protein IscW_ISCW004983 [Ixodes scapularis]|eukprot:XP_002434078.1 hypothetical protein IscW_ISCW004983 [Ixodes scapularis]